MPVFTAAAGSNLWAPGHFLGKILDEWANDAQEFVHTKLPHLLVVLVIAAILSRLISIGANRMIILADRKDSRPGRTSQVRTFASVLRTSLNGILWTLTTIQVLNIIGINLAPLLSISAIAGVAIGLAAQTIVKDVLNGMLIILEDQFNVGETVRLTGMTGTVEVMTLRRTEIRDGDGTLYVVPNSQITTVANLSRDFSVATVNVSVDFSAAPDKVIPLLNEVAMGIRKDPAFSPVFLKDPEVLGVDSIAGSQVIYPVIFRTQATKQYGPIREFRRRIRLALEANGMLPGDPMRVFREFASNSDSSSHPQLSEGSPAPPRPAKSQAVDPTAIPAVTHNPFTGEGM